MISIEELREFQAEFEPKRLEYQQKYKELEKLRQKFTRVFPKDRIQNLTLEQFVQGKRSTDSFCYWIERKTTELGHIQGATSQKFGVFYSKKAKSYRFLKKYKSEEDARTQILTQIRTLLDGAQQNDFAIIQESPVSPMFKGKILYLYFPDKFLNIFSERHVDFYLTCLRVNVIDPDLDLIAKRLLLKGVKDSDAVMSTWTTNEFSNFLYSTWPPPSKSINFSKKLKEYVDDFPAPKDTKPIFINRNTAVVPTPPSIGGPRTPSTTDFEAKTRRNKLAGNQGEEIVFLEERRVLRLNGKRELAKKVRFTSKEDDGAGYDILSFELDGREKLIEVKSTVLTVPAPNCNFRFFLSANELDQARNLKNYHLYIVFEVNTNTPKIWPIANPAGLEPLNLLLKPSPYTATLTIA